MDWMYEMVKEYLRQMKRENRGRKIAELSNEDKVEFEIIQSRRRLLQKELREMQSLMNRKVALFNHDTELFWLKLREKYKISDKDLAILDGVIREIPKNTGNS